MFSPTGGAFDKAIDYRPIEFSISYHYFFQLYVEKCRSGRSRCTHERSALTPMLKNSIDKGICSGNGGGAHRIPPTKPFKGLPRDTCRLGCPRNAVSVVTKYGSGIAGAQGTCRRKSVRNLSSSGKHCNGLYRTQHLEVCRRGYSILILSDRDSLVTGSVPTIVGGCFHSWRKADRVPRLRVSRCHGGLVGWRLFTYHRSCTFDIHLLRMRRPLGRTKRSLSCIGSS